MGGWVPIEKDLLTDRRFRRLTALYHRLQHVDGESVTPERYTCNACAHTCLGMLVGLWLHADSHLRENDVLPEQPEELDSMLGWPGFCDVLSETSHGEWMRVPEDRSCVILPNYQSHNGMEARKRKTGAKRVERFRQRQKALSNAVELPAKGKTDVCNASALPDQTKPYQTNLEINVHGLDKDAFAEWVAYRRSIRKPLHGASLAKLAVKLAALGSGQRAAVEHSIAQGFQGLYPPTDRGQNPPHDAEHAALAKLHARRDAIGLAGFRDATAGESADAYRKAQDAEWQRRKDAAAPPLPEVLKRM